MAFTTDWVKESKELLSFISRITNSDIILVHLAEDNDHILRPIAWYGLNDYDARQFVVRPGVCLIGLTFHKQMPHAVPELNADRRVRFTELMKKLGMKQAICYPISDHTRISGVITLVKVTTSQFSPMTWLILPVATAYVAGLLIRPKNNERTEDSPADSIGNFYTQDPIEMLTNLGERSVKALITYDRLHQYSLTETLWQYLNYQDPGIVCKNLFIHRNTLRYRLERVEQVTGLRLANPWHRVALMLGFLKRGFNQIQATGLPDLFSNVSG